MAARPGRGFGSAKSGHLRHLDGRSDVEDLVRASGGDEDRVAFALHKVVATHALLAPQPAPQLVVQIEARVMNRVRQLVGDPLLLRDLPQEG
eukprot:5994124-Prymnesium_polylepis.1